MSARNYFSWCLILMASFLGFGALLNRVVDPFWYYNDFNIAGFNAARTEFNRYERHIKPIELIRR